MGKLGKGLFGIAAIGMTAAVIGTLDTGSAEAEISQIGYFKDDDRNRIQAYCSEGTPTREQAEATFDRITRTEGAMVLAVIVDCTNQQPNGDALSAAPTTQDALALMVEGPFSDWTWRLRVNPAGEETIDNAEH